MDDSSLFFIAGELGVDVVAVASARETTATAGVPATGASGMTEAIGCPRPVATRWTVQLRRAAIEENQTDTTSDIPPATKDPKPPAGTRVWMTRD